MEVSVRQAGQSLSRLINQVAFGQQPVFITSRNKLKAVLLSIQEYERLTQPAGLCPQALETAQQLREALAAQCGVLAEDWVAAARTEREIEQAEVAS